MSTITTQTLASAARGLLVTIATVLTVATMGVGAVALELDTPQREPGQLVNVPGYGNEFPPIQP